MAKKHHIFKHDGSAGALCGIPDRNGIVYNTGNNVTCKICLKKKKAMEGNAAAIFPSWTKGVALISAIAAAAKISHGHNIKFINPEKKMKKYSAFVLFGKGSGYMEFSNSIHRLKKLILILGVTKVKIYDQKTNKKIITLTCKQKAKAICSE